MLLGALAIEANKTHLPPLSGDKSLKLRDKKVSILTIEVINENELFSQVFCESLAKETSDFYIQTKSKKARINVNVLQTQVDSVRNALNGAISMLSNASLDLFTTGISTCESTLTSPWPGKCFAVAITPLSCMPFMKATPC